VLIDYIVDNINKISRPLIISQTNNAGHFVLPNVIRLPRLLIVSENMICYKLDKNLSIDKIAQDIQKLLKAQQNLESKVLVIKCENIINYTGDSLLPKLTYHE
jgi:hypothetical protein